MATDTSSKPIVAPGIDLLLDLMHKYGAIVLLFGTLAFFAYVQFNVVTFIPGAAWHVPEPPPAAEAKK